MTKATNSEASEVWVTPSELFSMDLEIIWALAFDDSYEYENALYYFDGSPVALAGTTVEADARKEWKEGVVETFEKHHGFRLEDATPIFENWYSYFYGE